jgi:hypothetical protein
LLLRETEIPPLDLGSIEIQQSERTSAPLRPA